MEIEVETHQKFSDGTGRSRSSQAIPKGEAIPHFFRELQSGSPTSPVASILILHWPLVGPISPGKQIPLGRSRRVTPGERAITGLIHRPYSLGIAWTERLNDCDLLLNV